MIIASVGGVTLSLMGTPFYWLVNGRGAVMFFFVLSGFIQLEQIHICVETAGAGMVLFAVLACAPLAKPLSSNVGKWLGILSFPVYLVQISVLNSISSKLYIETVAMSSVPRFVLMAGVTVVIIGLLSLPFVFIDRWWVGLTNRVSHALINGRVAPAQMVPANPVVSSA